ncbi:MAG: DUF1203 domain-containing protein [Verrucomicrobia bacterium]|nr:DUF1203 domain-containing protein [Verrucomicrobiota bacterium]
MSRPIPYRIVPLPLQMVEDVRRTGVDCLGHRVTPEVNLEEGRPCRLTLRYIRKGERLLLLSHSPFAHDHPYREIGPIFVLADGGQPYADIHRFPPDFDPTTRVFRSYDAAERIVDARVGAPDPDAVIADLFANPRAECIHVRSLTYGCYTFRIERA